MIATRKATSPPVGDRMIHGVHAFSTMVGETNSKRAADNAARSLREAFVDHPLKAVLVYATVNHDQPEILRRLRAHFGPDVALLGCSVQGVLVRGDMREGGFLIGAMGLGGSDLRVAPAIAREIHSSTHRKGVALASDIRSALAGDPICTLVCWDPRAGMDVEDLLGGMSRSMKTPVVGGGAGQPFGRIVRTYQYFGEEVTRQAAIALGLSGPFSAEIGVAHGTSRAGVTMNVTRSEGTTLFEIDGRPALDVWREVTGWNERDVNDQDYLTSWAAGIECKQRNPDGSETAIDLVRMAIAFDVESGALIMPTAIASGTRIVLHHRTTQAMFDGTLAMGRHLAARTSGMRPWAALGFECCARASPFLGEAGSMVENTELQKLLAPDVPWLGMLAWGEAAPVSGAARFLNFSYPLVVLAA